MKNKLKFIFAIIFWLSVWALASCFTKPILLPSPVLVLKALIAEGATDDFWFSCFFSLLRIFSGFAAGIIAGTVLSALSSLSKIIKALISPLMSVIKATPVASFIILAWVWISTGKVPAFISFLLVLPIVYTNLCEGVENTDVKLIEVAKIYGFSFVKKLKFIYLPQLKPYFLSALKSSLGLAWKAGVAAEVLCQPKMSLGRAIYESKLYLETPRLFAVTIVVILLSYILEKLIIGLVFKLNDDKAR